MAQTRLSVIMTNYNHGHFLEERLNSIIAQLEPNDEIVIIDDASSDNSVEIIEKIKLKNAQIRFFQNSQNVGVIRSVNLALKESRGKYIASLAADDKILPGFVSKTMEVLEKNPHLSLCCSDCGLSFDGFPNRDPDKIETTKLLPNVQKTVIFSAKKVSQKIYQHHFWIPGHTAIIKKEKMIEFGGFKDNLEYLCDWFLIHSIALSGGAGYIPETLSVWRQHNKTYSASLQKNEETKRKIFFELFKELSKKENQHIRKNFAKSTLLFYYVKYLFWKLIWMPQYYDMVIPVVGKALKNKLKKVQSIFNH